MKPKNEFLISSYSSLNVLGRGLDFCEAYEKGYVDLNGICLIENFDEIQRSSTTPKCYSEISRLCIVLEILNQKPYLQEQEDIIQLVKAIRECVVQNCNSEKEGTDFIFEINKRLEERLNDYSSEIKSAIDYVLFSGDTELSSPYNNILECWEDIIAEDGEGGMVAGALGPGDPQPGIAGINDAQLDPAKNTVVPKKRKKKKDEKAYDASLSSKKELSLRKILNKL